MDETRIHQLSLKVGGRFRLAALIQKRLLELNRGQRQLVKEYHRNTLYTVLQEIEEDKLGLEAPEGESASEAGAAPSLEPPLEDNQEL